MVRRFGSGARSAGMKRAYALGHRGKAKCVVCGNMIHNRMVMAKGRPLYAHTSCSRKKPEYTWEEVW